MQETNEFRIAKTRGRREAWLYPLHMATRIREVGTSKEYFIDGIRTVIEYFDRSDCPVVRKNEKVRESFPFEKMDDMCEFIHLSLHVECTQSH